MKAGLLIAGGLAALTLTPALFLLAFADLGGSEQSCPPGSSIVVSPGGINGLDAASLRNAAAVITTGNALRVSRNALLIALMVARQESSLHSLANDNVPESLQLPHDGVGHDHDSVGIMQQRASWGTVAQRMDVPTSAGLFYRRLTGTPDWAQMSLNDAAQRVQASATPLAYGQWQPLAEQLLRNAGGAAVPACAVMAVSSVSGAAGVAIGNAESKLGTMYEMGGDCLDAHSADPGKHCDCSSLVMTAWAAAGKILPRTSEQQFLAANVTRIPAQQMQPGDLIFYNPGEDGQPGLPGHVALYIGGGKLIEAPFAGHPVHIIGVYQPILAVGRVN